MDYGLYIGSLELDKACLGSDEAEVYLGDELLWPQIREFKAALTLNDSSVVYVPLNGNTTLAKEELSGAAGSLTAITEAVVSSAVTVIGTSAFQGCSNLSSVTFPDNLTTIGQSSFYQCTHLESVTIPSAVTTIQSTAFSRCSGMTGVTVEATTPPRMLSSNAFFNVGCPFFVPCASINAYQTAANWSTYAGQIEGYGCVGSPKAAITLTGGSTVLVPYNGISELRQSELTRLANANEIASLEIYTGVTSLGVNLCVYFSSLTSVTIPNTVTTIGNNSFRGTGIVSLNIPDSVTTLSTGSFSYCTSLTGVTFGSGITSIGESAFSSDTNLTNVAIPDSVTSIGNNAFYTCSNITGVTIGSGITSIGKTVFRGINRRTTGVTIAAATPPIIPDGVANFPFYDSTYPIYVPCDSVSAYQSETNWSSYASRIQGYGCPPKAILTLTGGTTVEIPSNGSSTITSGEVGTAVSNMSDIVAISIGSAVTTIGEDAFKYADGVTSLTLPDSVTAISGSAFYGMEHVSSLTLPSGLTEIGLSAFYYCQGLTSLTIPSGVTDIGDNAFAECTGLTGVTFEGATPPSLGYTVFDNTSCIIYVPCGSMASYTDEENWSDLASRMQEYGCGEYSARIHLKYSEYDDELGEDVITEEDRYIYGEITREAVESALTDHDDVEDTDVVRWGDVMYIEVASGVTSIGSGAFDFHDDPMDGWKMSYVKFLGTTPPTIGSHAFGGGDEYIDSLRYYILVPSAATTAYTNAFSAQSADFDGVYPSDVPSMAIVWTDWESDPEDPQQFIMPIYGSPSKRNLMCTLGTYDDADSWWGQINGDINEVRIGSAATSIAADAFSNTAESVNCDDGVFKWIIDTDTVTSLGEDAFGWLNMKEVWLSGSTNVLHLDSMDHASFKALCTCPQYDEELDDWVDTDTWFNYNIYVDDSLLSAYQADSKWSAYGNRIKGESDWEQPEEDWCNHMDEEEPQIEP